MIRSDNKAKVYFSTIVAMYVVIIFVTIFVPEKYLTSELSIILGQSIVIIPGLIYTILHKGKNLKRIPFKKVSIVNVMLIILFTYTMVPIVTTINAISMLFVENQVSDVINDFTKNPFLLSLFLVAVLPGVFEEFSFRGIIYNELKTKNIFLAMITSGILFGVFHMNVNQFLYATVLGILLVLVTEATGSIISSMIMHFTFNANSIILTYLLDILENIAGTSGTDVDKIAQESTQTTGSILVIIGIYGFISIITGTLGFFLFRWICKRCGRWEHIKSIFARRKTIRTEKRKLQAQDIVSNILFIMSIIVAVLVMITSEIKV